MNKEQCVKCGKERGMLKCSGCLETYCYDHLNDHRQELNQQFDQIEFNRDLFRQTLNEQMIKNKYSLLIEQIDQWESNSIEIIKQIANESRQKLIEHKNNYFYQMEINLNKLTDQLRQTRQENNFNEMDLNQFKQTFLQLTRELHQSPNILIQQDSIPLINQISIVTSHSK
jgi:hypothetical protein